MNNTYAQTLKFYILKIYANKSDWKLKARKCDVNRGARSAVCRTTFANHCLKYTSKLKISPEVWWKLQTNDVSRTFGAENFECIFAKLKSCNQKVSKIQLESVFIFYGARVIFQAEHTLYTPGLDENRGSSDFVHAIWICYKLQCTKFCTLQ